MDDLEMDAVLTLGEACDLWRKDPSNVMRDAWKLRIRMRKSKGVWLVSRRDCERRWGKPQTPDRTYGRVGRD